MPFTVTIPEAERDSNLSAKLAEELPGILAWAVRSCLAWRAVGLGLPPAVKAAKASYRDEMDVLGPFLDEATVAAEGCRVTAREFYEAYEKWCAANCERPKSQKGFAMSLRERGFEAVKGTKGVRCCSGLRLRRQGEAAAAWRSALIALVRSGATLQADRAAWPEPWREAFEERAGIIEFDGGRPRGIAEQEAERLFRIEHARAVIHCFALVVTPVAAAVATGTSGTGPRQRP